MIKYRLITALKISSLCFSMLMMFDLHGEAWTDQSFGDNYVSSVSSQTLNSYKSSDHFYKNNVTLNSNEVVVGVMETDTANIEPDGPEGKQAVSLLKNLNERRIGKKSLDICS